MRKFGELARVDIIDRLPTPFGLVRSGVAPDHQDTKVPSSPEIVPQTHKHQLTPMANASSLYC